MATTPESPESPTPPIPEAVAGRTPLVILVPHTHWDREWYQPFD